MDMPQDDNEHLMSDSRSSTEVDDSYYPQKPRNWSRGWVLHLLILGINIGFGIFMLRASRTSIICPESTSQESLEFGKLRKHELVLTEPVIEYQDQVFISSGFHRHAHDEPSIYETPRTHETDKAWEKLTTVGFVSLTAEQNSQLANSTVESLSRPGTYPVALGVFHQLHCLNYIRILLFPQEGDGKGETDAQRAHHKNHCLDYLRQVVQCHGDTTPLSVYYEKTHSGYAFDHAVTHSCRNFDKIYDWAAENAADLHIE
ncbi:hypothetical protein G7Y89_g2162 [Cudoniella acicularis]|uniref:Cyclochlorotine biosynthesis protein O n=1 Tax=Cudoniella acicularis TaxID=354080 RepID=A0A8H4RTY1_9HELO|nr:hypothetical protein G7Y89_g2162 [Cudoniella acicularis]